MKTKSRPVPCTRPYPSQEDRHAPPARCDAPPARCDAPPARPPPADYDVGIEVRYGSAQSVELLVPARASVTMVLDAVEAKRPGATKDGEADNGRVRVVQAGREVQFDDLIGEQLGITQRIPPLILVPGHNAEIEKHNAAFRGLPHEPVPCRCSRSFHDYAGRYHETYCGAPSVPRGGEAFAWGQGPYVHGLDGTTCDLCNGWSGCANPNCMYVNLDGVTYRIMDDAIVPPELLDIAARQRGGTSRGHRIPSAGPSPPVEPLPPWGYPGGPPHQPDYDAPPATRHTFAPRPDPFHSPTPGYHTYSHHRGDADAWGMPSSACLKL